MDTIFDFPPHLRVVVCYVFPPIFWDLVAVDWFDGFGGCDQLTKFFVAR
jgi:hypothetical protein